MNICVMSDSHGRTDRIDEVLSRHSDIDLLIHAGDHADDVINRKDIPVKTVCGNCDLPGSAPEEELMEVGGIRILLAHGHLFKVKQSLLRLQYRAKETGASLVIFGHSHVPIIVEEEGIVFCNPGSLSHPRGTVSVPSYAILSVFQTERNICIQLYGVNGDVLPGFHFKHTFG